MALRKVDPENYRRATQTGQYTVSGSSFHQTNSYYQLITIDGTHNGCRHPARIYHRAVLEAIWL
jgi:hypothetical protein